MTLHIHLPQKLSNFLDVLKADGRRLLFSAAGNALKIAVRDHIRRDVPRRHLSAERLGASPTGHLERGAARVSFTADETSATVVIPIAGMSRAFGDLTITPKHAGALTIPQSAVAYGHRVGELRRLGWEIFRPKGKDYLLGRRDDETELLYLLRTRVTLRQDRSLLPSDTAIASTASRAMALEIMRIQRKAG